MDDSLRFELHEFEENGESQTAYQIRLGHLVACNFLDGKTYKLQFPHNESNEEPVCQANDEARDWVKIQFKREYAGCMSSPYKNGMWVQTRGRYPPGIADCGGSICRTHLAENSFTPRQVEPCECLTYSVPPNLCMETCIVP